MKKSKVIIPALGVLILSTAASVTGTVAWFTANRSYTMTAGEFAVVNTKDNLEVVLAATGPVAADNSAKSITITNTNDTSSTLTDASFEHNAIAENIIVPNDDGDKVAKVIPLASADYTNGANGLLRETTTSAGVTYNVYSAFTWTMTFKINFSASASLNKGLFFDVDNSYAHEKVVYTTEEIAAAGGVSATGLFTDAALGTAATAVEGKLSTTAYTGAGVKHVFYKEAPDDTGKAFRLAFVPTSIPSGSYGETRVWAPNQTAALSTFVSGKAVTEALPNITDGVGEDDNATAYGTSTTNNPGTGLATYTATATSCLIASADNELTVPDSTTTTTAAKAMKNFIGYAAPAQGSHVDLEFKVVAWYEGTDLNITTATDTIYETIVTQLTFGTYDLTIA